MAQAPTANVEDPAARRPGTVVRIDLIGDSTQTDNAGYGRGFCANLAAKVDCLNMAKGGASTKTFREDGLWDRALATRPDYMVIQFGHNDMESPEHLARQVTMAQYEANLRRFADEAPAHGINPSTRCEWWIRTGCAVVAMVGIAHADSLRVVTVAHEGKADFHTLQEAVDHAPATGEVIRLAPGTYREKVHINTANIHLIGTGAKPEDVVLSWDDSAGTAGGTGNSGSVSVNADGFEAENLTIENTWENEHSRAQEGSQAVALLMSSDRAVLDHVRLLGAQDTLYANSRTCHENVPKADPAPADTPTCQASRQYFRDCYIEGHVDFIFGDAKAVFVHCELHPRRNPIVMLTAQSKHFPNEDSGYYFLHCKVTGEDNGDRVVLGRPWRDYATVVFYDTDMQKEIDAAGWSDWDGRLKTSTYLEYKSHGPGVNGGHRIVSYPELTTAEEKKLTPRALLAGTDSWDPVAEADALRKLVQR